MESVVVDGFYAALHSKTESYRRICVTGKSGAIIAVAFIDYGEIDLIPLCNIRPLLPEFAELPAQAMKAQLFGKMSYFVKHIKFYIITFILFQESHRLLEIGRLRMLYFLRNSLMEKFFRLT